MTEGIYRIDRRNPREERTERVRQGRRRRDNQVKSQPSGEPVIVSVGNSSNTSSSSTTTATASTSATGNATSDLKNLVTRYVSQYEKQSGVSLSEEARAAKEAEVLKFYSQSGREGRLQAVVF